MSNHTTHHTAWDAALAGTNVHAIDAACADLPATTVWVV